MNPPPLPGFHLVHKPVGATSFSVVRRFHDEAAAAGVAKLAICHGGTLDPFASGLLVILVGQATRLIDLLHAAPKEYEAEVAWGRETDNGDPGGSVVSEGTPEALAALSVGRLDAALAGFAGWRDQVPPSTSARRIGGVRAYERVHRGETVEMPPSRVFLHEARWLSHDLPRRSRLFLRSGRGYYVRALARDLGRLLGTGAHLASLRRTAIGPWNDPGDGEPKLVAGEELLPWLPARRLDAADAESVAKGRAIPEGEIEPPSWCPPEGFPVPDGPVRGLAGGRLVVLLRRDGGELHPVANLRGGL